MKTFYTIWADNMVVRGTDDASELPRYWSQHGDIDIWESRSRAAYDRLHRHLGSYGPCQCQCCEFVPSDDEACIGSARGSRIIATKYPNPS